MIKIVCLVFLFSVAKLAAAQTTNYEYDKLYRLTKILYSNGSNITYQYDANGNRTYQHNVGAVKVYVFNGNGNWSDAANWLNSNKPPLELPTGAQILIDPVVAGECLLDVPQKLMPGAFLRVETGKKFKVPGNINMQ
jgi:YD repeat-containing protein